MKNVHSLLDYGAAHLTPISHTKPTAIHSLTVEFPTRVVLKHIVIIIQTKHSNTQAFHILTASEKTPLTKHR